MEENGWRGGMGGVIRLIFHSDRRPSPYDEVGSWESTEALQVHGKVNTVQSLKPTPRPQHSLPTMCAWTCVSWLHVCVCVCVCLRFTN
jgi:hypothetical protein